jgi:hypothetical protein
MVSSSAESSGAGARSWQYGRVRGQSGRLVVILLWLWVGGTTVLLVRDRPSLAGAITFVGLAGAVLALRNPALSSLLLAAFLAVGLGRIRPAWLGIALSVASLALATAAALVVLTRRSLMRTEPIPMEPIPAEEVDAGALPVVLELERRGFHRVGGFRARLTGVSPTNTILTNAAEDRWAEVTDRVWEVSSAFGDHRLSTTTSGRAPLPATTLRQVVAAEEVDRLLLAHQQALDLVSVHGARRPDRLAGVDLLERVRADTDAAVANLRNVGLREAILVAFGRGLSSRPLVEDDGAAERIRRWLAVGP